MYSFVLVWMDVTTQLELYEQTKTVDNATDRLGNQFLSYRINQEMFEVK